MAVKDVRPLDPNEFGEFLKQWLGGQHEHLPVLEKGNTLTTATVPFRQYLADKVTLAVQRRTPVRNLLPRVRAEGGAQFQWYLVSQLPTLSQAAFGEANTPATGEPAYGSPLAAVPKAIGFRGDVTAQAQLVAANFHNQLAALIEYLMIAVVRAEERMLIKGDADQRPNEINGLLKLITTNTIDKAGEALTWADIVDAAKAIWLAGGEPRYIICGPREAATITQLYLNVVKPTVIGEPVPYGAVVNKVVTPYGEMELLISPDLAPEARTIGGSEVQASDILILDPQNPVAMGGVAGQAIEVHEWLPLEAWVFPMQTTLTTPVVVWEFIALAVRAEKFQAKIVNIGPSA